MKREKYLYKHRTKRIGDYEYESYNLPYFRLPKFHRLIKRLKHCIKELNDEYGLSLKRISNEKIQNYDDWEDKDVSSYFERKCWKRNSRRKHQWWKNKKNQ